MKFLVLLMLVAGAAWSKPLFLVTSQHPHYLEKLFKEVEIVKSEGRILLVTPKGGVLISKTLVEHLRPITMEEIKQYEPEVPELINVDQKVVKILSDVKVEEMKELTKK